MNSTASPWGDRKVYGYGWNGIGQFGNGLSSDSAPIQAGQIIRINDSSHSYHGKSTAPDGAADVVRDLRFDQAIFLRGGILCRSGWTYRCRAAYLYQIDSNGSTTYLTKVTAPDGDSEDYLDTPFLSLAIFWRRGIRSRSGRAYRSRAALFIKWMPMYLSDQSDGSRWSPE